MKASKFVGNPQVECEAVTITTTANSLGLSTDLPLAQISAPGATLFGEDYFNLWVHLVGLYELRSESSSAPLFQIGQISIRLLRQRYFYFSDTTLNRGLTAPIKLDLISPCFPFLEITWNEADGLKESLQGLHYFEPDNLKRHGSAFVWQIDRLLRQLKRRGRRRVFLNREDYESALRQAKEKLIVLGQPVTQEAVADQLGYDERMLRYWNKHFKVQWREFRHH